jgi:hypothetical protein
MELTDRLELDILLALNSQGGKARYGKLHREVRAGGLPKQTFQRRLNSLLRKNMLQHTKIRGGPLGQSWWILTSKAKRTLRNMSPDPWREIIDGYEIALKSGKIPDQDKPAYIEKIVESVLEGAFKTAQKLTVAAGLEKDLARREALKIYVVEHWLGDLICRLVDLLHENRAFASEKLKDLGRPVATIRL